MKLSNLNRTNKLALTALCAFFLNFKAIGADANNGCIDQDLLETVKSNTRKAMPNILGFSSLSLGASGFLKSATTQAGNIIGLTGSSINVVGALLNTYNWYVDREHINGFVHNTLNGMVVASNLASAGLGYASVNSDDPVEKNALGVASLIAGASGLLFKGIDLFFMPSPKHEYDHKVACRAARQETANAGDIETGKK